MYRALALLIAACLVTVAVSVVGVGLGLVVAARGILSGLSAEDLGGLLRSSLMAGAGISLSAASIYMAYKALELAYWSLVDWLEEC